MCLVTTLHKIQQSIVFKVQVQTSGGQTSDGTNLGRYKPREVQTSDGTNVGWYRRREGTNVGKVQTSGSTNVGKYKRREVQTS